MTNEQQNQEKAVVLRPSWKNYIPHYSAIVAIVVAMVYISVKFQPSEGWGNVLYAVGMAGILYIIGRVLLIRFGERFTVNEKEVVMEHGLLNKSSIEVGIHQIRTIQVKQSIWQRVVNIGDLLIASAGTEGYEIIAHGVDAPYQLRDRIQEARASNQPAPAEVAKHDD